MRRKMAAVILLMATALPVVADGIAIELNAMQTQEASCRLVFTARSEAGVEDLVLETAILDNAGGVVLLTLFDFMKLPAGSLRVRQFDLGDTACDDLSMLLFNGIDSCSGPGCASGLSAASRVETLEVLQ